MIGSNIRHYQIVEHLGGGGMGVVYRARDTKLLRDVALKFLPREWSRDPEAKRRFLREAQVASGLDHVNICTIHEVGETEDGQLFIAMACYDGETLRHHIAEGSLDIDDAIDLAEQILRGLQKAHAADVVHRDIKPANIVVTRDGVAKVLDFGLAKMSSVTMTRSHTTLGTAAYMSPEQVRGEEVDARTDLWSFGVVFYEILTGQRPFRGDFESATFYSITNEEPKSAREVNPAIPAHIDALLSRCLEKDPDDRYPSASVVLDDLAAFRHGTVAAESGTGQSVGATATRGLATPAQTAGAGAADYPGRSDSSDVSDNSDSSVPRARASDSLRDPGPSGAMLMRRSRTAALSLVGVAVVLIALVALVPGLRNTLGLGGDGAGVKDGNMRLAVLPFENLGLDQQTVDGLIYTITSKLTTLEQFQGALAVVPPRDVYSRGITNSEEAADQLRVSHVVQGSVRPRNAGFTLTISLVDARDNVIVNSRELNLTGANLVDLQSGIVTALATLLEVEVTPQSRAALMAGQTGIPEAYDHYTRARGYLQRFEDETNVDAALDLFRLAIKEDSSYALAYAGMAEAYLQKYDATRDASYIDRAVSAGESAVALDENLAAARVALGQTYFVQGDMLKAELEYLRALQLEPGNAAAHNELGDVYYAQNKLDKAEESLRKAIDLKPDYWFYHNELGQYYSRLGEPTKAIEPFKKVIDLMPENPWGYNNVGSQYYQLGDLDEASEFYRQATSVNPNSHRPVAMAMRNMAFIDYYRDNFEDAASLYERSLAHEGSDLDGWVGLGDARHFLGDESGAVDAWRNAINYAQAQLDVNANDTWALDAIATSNAKLGHPDEALAASARLLQAERLDGYHYLGLTITYELTNQRDRAIEFAKRALESGATMIELEATAWLDNMRQDPNFATLSAQFADHRARR